MTARPGEALDTDEAILACENANESAEVVFGYGCSGGNGWWFKFISALNEQDVVLVWDGPAEVRTIFPPTPPRPADDADQLLAVADWLDRFDEARGAVGENEMQRDLRRIASLMDGPAEVASKRPGGWVDGIGWVALLFDLRPDDLVVPAASQPSNDRPSWMDHADPHMDGSVTYTMPKYADRPGQVRVTLPAPVVADLYRMAYGTVPTEGDR